MEVKFISSDDKFDMGRGSMVRGKQTLQDMPFVRIKSEGRDLDLVFENIAEADAFIFMLTSREFNRRYPCHDEDG